MIKRKRIVVLTLVAMMLLNGCAHQAALGYDIKYKNSKGVLTVGGNGVMPDSSGVETPNVDSEKTVDYKWNNEKDHSTASKIVVEEGITHIGAGAFAFFLNVQEVELPDDMVSIGDGAFSLCMSLKRINMPQAVKEIGMSAFYGCSELSEINLPEGVEFLGHSAFAGCSVEEAFIPSSVEEIEENVFGGCQHLKSISVSEKNERYYSDKGVLFDRETETLLTYPPAREEYSYNVPDGIKTIAMNAFWSCNTKTITLPISITTVKKNAFNQSDGLERIYYLGSEEEWNRIDFGEDGAPDVETVFGR